MAEAALANGPPPPVSVRAGDQTVQIDGSPASVCPTTVEGPVLVQPDGKRLVLLPRTWVEEYFLWGASAGQPLDSDPPFSGFLSRLLSPLLAPFRWWPSTRLLVLPLIALGLFLGVEVFPGADRQPGPLWWLWMALGLIGAGYAVLAAAFSLKKALHARVCWDRGSGQMFQGRLRARRQRPLADVLAVQVLQAVGVSRYVPADRTCPHYQLNLIFNDPGRSRLNLTNHIDLKWALWAGGKVADFLGVPLVEQTTGERPAAAPAATVQVGQRTIPLEAGFLRSWPLCPPTLLGGDQPTLVTDKHRLRICGPSFWFEGEHTDAVKRFLVGTGVILGRLFAILVLCYWLFAVDYGAGKHLLGHAQHLSALEWAGWSLALLVAVAVDFLVVRFVVYKALFNYRVIFDRVAGLMHVCGGLFWRKSMLAEIVAVQLLGKADYDLAHGLPGAPQPVGVVSRCYQVNLVLDDADRLRLHLLISGDQEWARRNGKQLADFLGVPLVEQLPG
jgi:hypothetical protein